MPRSNIVPSLQPPLTTHLVLRCDGRKDEGLSASSAQDLCVTSRSETAREPDNGDTRRQRLTPIIPIAATCCHGWRISSKPTAASGVLPNMRLWLLALAMIVAAERAADASCGCLPKLSPESGSIPLRGSLYLGDVHLIERGEVSVRWIGTPGTATWTVDDGVARLDYSGAEGSELVVMTFKRYERARYKLESGWRAPTTAPRAIRFEHQESEWTCARTDALVIELDQPTAAVRVRWTHRDLTETLVLPTDGRVPLGLIGCCGTYISPAELHDGGALELVAIRVDGSEAPILGVPSFVSSDMYSPETTVGDRLRGIVRPVVAASYAAAGQPHPGEPFVPQWLGLLISLGFLVPLVYMSRRISA